MPKYRGGAEASRSERDKLRKYEKRVNPANKDQMQLLEEMRAHTKALEELRKDEDPRMVFTTQEFKDASRAFSDNLKNNFGRPFEYAYVKKHPWSEATVVKLEQPLDKDGNPWPLDGNGKPIL